MANLIHHHRINRFIINNNEINQNDKAYKATFIDFMSYLHNDQYNNNHEFTQEQLLAIKDTDVVNYLAFKAFDDPNKNANRLHNPNVNPLVKRRSTTIERYKKAISRYMLNPHIPYDMVADYGNPTRSPRITQFIDDLKLMESKKTARPPQERRPLTSVEFEHLIEMLKSYPNGSIIHKYGMPAMVAFQYSMIARVDDVTQFRVADLQVHRRFPTQALQARLFWSKNVRREEDAPYQILLGAMHSVYCVFINIAIWLECVLGSNVNASRDSPYVFCFSENNGIPVGGKLSKKKASGILCKLFKGEYFHGDRVGSHSIRKYGSTSCRDNGCDPDEMDRRGRWKPPPRGSDPYVKFLPYSDAKACISLCPRGACTYTPKPNCVTPDFILLNVTPNIRNKFGPEVAVLLGYALMWTIFSDDAAMVPDEIKTRVTAAYSLLPNKLADGINPINRKEVMLHGDCGNFTLTEIDDEVAALFDLPNDGVGGDVVGGGRAPGGGVGGSMRSYFMGIMSHSKTLERLVQESKMELKREMGEVRQDVQQLFRHQRTMNNNIQRISRQPNIMFRNAVVDANDGEQQALPLQNNIIADNAINADQHVDQNATLSSNPKTAHTLWQEWEIGIDGRKPAKMFTKRERGRYKVKFCRRKVFWDLVSRMVRSGNTAQVACDRILLTYGDLPISTLLNRIRDDKKRGIEHPLLR